MRDDGLCTRHAFHLCVRQVDAVREHRLVVYKTSGLVNFEVVGGPEQAFGFFALDDVFG